MSSNREILEGYVVDIACLRKWPREDVPKKARTHTRQCALEGHCLESGYGLVDEQTGRMDLLEPAATPKVVKVIMSSPRQAGIRVRVTRERRDGEMTTTSVEELPSPS